MIKNIYVTDIDPGTRISDLFLVTEKNMAVSQKGAPYLSLRLQDKTGQVEGRVWDNAKEMSQLFRKGDVIHINARAVKYRSAIQLAITQIEKLADSEIEPAEYSTSSKYDIDTMFVELMEIAETIETPALRNLLHLILDDEDLSYLFKRAPAAKGLHHHYIGGLLEHTLSVTRLLSAAAEHYQNLNRDLMLTGGILHDVGKIYELSFKKLIDYTDKGRLIGHIVLGVELIDSKIPMIEDFPESLALELRHILLSHHGVLEYGSPKRPKTLEAVIINMMDDLDAKVNAFREFIDVSPDDNSNWTPYHRLFERFIYKGDSENTEE
jgi:3'-5' exoribonuclease